MSLLVASSKHPIIPDLVPPVPWPAETPGSLKTSDSSLSPGSPEQAVRAILCSAN